MRVARAGLGVAVAGAVVAACSMLTPQRVEGGWIVPTPFPLPPGATAVPLEIASLPRPLRPDVTYDACPAALLAPVLIEHRPDDPARPIHYRLVDGGREVRLSWQEGFSARLNPGLEIVAPDGKVVARQGEATEPFGGGEMQPGIFGVCLGEYTPKRADPMP